MVKEANEQLADGKEKVLVSKKVDGLDEPIQLGFENDSIEANNKFSSKSLVGKSVSVQAVKSKSYKAYIKNTAGLDFSHTLYGQFTYDAGKLKGATKNVTLSGWAYEKSHDTPPIDKLDPSVWEVKSTGTFRGAKILKEYKTYLVVRLLGSGDYTITKAKITM